MKIPELTSPELTELLTTKASLAQRAQASSEKVRALRALKNEGQNNIDDKESRIAMVLAGEDIPISNDVDAQLSTALLQWEAINEAQEVVKKDISKEKRNAAAPIMKALKTPYNDGMKKICSSLADASAAWAELFYMKRQCIDKEIAFSNGVFELMADDVLGVPNSYSPLAHFLRDAQKLGFISRVPKELAQ